MRKKLAELVLFVRRLFHLLTGRRHRDYEKESSIVNQFHMMYYDTEMEGKTWGNTYWMGVPILKCPLDLWVYQEILNDVKPDWIIETGTHRGGSAHYMACLCDIFDRGRVITIDIDPGKDRPTHPRLEYITGSSTAPEILERVRSRIGADDRVMVILDSDHRKEHVDRELELYHPMVTRGSYLIVEDSNLNGHPVCPEFGPGPHESIEQFVSNHPAFQIDPARQKFHLTFSPDGFLKRIG